MNEPTLNQVRDPSLPTPLYDDDGNPREIKINIQSLYKIFGPHPKRALEQVLGGVGKSELLEKHGHVLGLKDINIDIPARGIAVIMGLSGSGKSTLIRHINRLIEPTDGKVLVDGEDVLQMNKAQLREFRRNKASMVFQKFGLLVHRTVDENVAYGLTIKGVAEAEALERGQKWIERVGLSGFEKHYPAQLSGGMQQRVGLARALATDADILLMDEAFSALDPLIRTDMQDILLELQTELHKTIVFITHDLDEALRIGDSIAILRDGAVVQQGDPQDIIMHPADDYIFDFVKDINRGRVLKARSIMGPIEQITAPSIRGRTTLEEALQAVAASPSGKVHVINVHQQHLGTLSIDQVIAGLARPESGAVASVYR